MAFATIGLEVGLRFTPATVRHARRLLPAVLAGIALLIAACAGLAVPLVAATGLTYRDAYLAAPGGIYAVLATAVGSGAETTFVLAAQALRLLSMILLAPPLVRFLTPGHGSGPPRHANAPRGSRR